VQFPPIAISEHHFDNGDSQHTVIGDFTTQTAANGTWSSSFNDPVAGSCSGAGTWTASHTFPITSTKLYLRFSCTGGLSGCLGVDPETGGTSTTFINTSDTLEYPMSLTGDISGTGYGFSLMLASLSSTDFLAEMLVGNQVLASAPFLVNSSAIKRYTVHVEGVDPPTQAGDTVILRITHLGGSSGAVIIGPPPDRDAFIVIPGQE
jgi:hypothetical protein